MEEEERHADPPRKLATVSRKTENIGAGGGGGRTDGPFCRTETSRNLTKSFTENNNIDLNHQRVIWLRKGKVEMRF